MLDPSVNVPLDVTGVEELGCVCQLVLQFSTVMLMSLSGLQAAVGTAGKPYVVRKASFSLDSSSAHVELLRKTPSRLSRKSI